MQRQKPRQHKWKRVVLAMLLVAFLVTSASLVPEPRYTNVQAVVPAGKDDIKELRLSIEFLERIGLQDAADANKQLLIKLEKIQARREKVRKIWDNITKTFVRSTALAFRNATSTFINNFATDLGKALSTGAPGLSELWHNRDDYLQTLTEAAAADALNTFSKDFANIDLCDPSSIQAKLSIVNTIALKGGRRPGSDRRCNLDQIKQNAKQAWEESLDNLTNLDKILSVETNIKVVGDDDTALNTSQRSEIHKLYDANKWTISDPIEAAGAEQVSSNVTSLLRIMQGIWVDEGFQEAVIGKGAVRISFPATDIDVDSVLVPKDYACVAEYKTSDTTADSNDRYGTFEVGRCDDSKTIVNKILENPINYGFQGIMFYVIQNRTTADKKPVESPSATDGTVLDASNEQAIDKNVSEFTTALDEQLEQLRKLRALIVSRQTLAKRCASRTDIERMVTAGAGGQQGIAPAFCTSIEDTEFEANRNNTVPSGAKTTFSSKTYAIPLFTGVGEKKDTCWFENYYGQTVPLQGEKTGDVQYFEDGNVVYGYTLPSVGNAEVTKGAFQGCVTTDIKERAAFASDYELKASDKVSGVFLLDKRLDELQPRGSDNTIFPQSYMLLKAELQQHEVQMKRMSAIFNAMLAQITKTTAAAEQLKKDLEEGNYKDPNKDKFDPNNLLATYSEGGNDLNTLLKTQQKVDNEAEQEKQNADWLSKINPVKGVSTKISGEILTPANVTDAEWDESVELWRGMGQYTGDVLADSVGVFTNSFITNMIKRLITNPPQQGPSNTGGGGGGPGNFTPLNLPGSRFTGPGFSLLGNNRPTLLSASNGIALAQDLAVRGVIGDPFITAIQEHFTLAEAIAGGNIPGTTVFGYQLSGPQRTQSITTLRLLNARDQNILSEAEMAALRRAGIVPVGWEFAAQRVKQLGQTYTLSQVVGCYEDPQTWNERAARCASDFIKGNVVADGADGANSDCKSYEVQSVYGPVVAGGVSCPDGGPITVDAAGRQIQHNAFYRLVDPNWVLKSPAAECRLEGYTNEINADYAFNELIRELGCVDYKMCLEEDADGNCLGESGYCVNAKEVWRFDGETCSPRAATCEGYTLPDGEQVYFKENSLTQSFCSAEVAGCQWYCADGDAASNTWSCDIAQEDITCSESYPGFNITAGGCVTATASGTPCMVPLGQSRGSVAVQLDATTTAAAETCQLGGKIRFDNDVQTCAEGSVGCRGWQELGTGFNLVKNGGFEDAVALKVFEEPDAPPATRENPMTALLWEGDGNWVGFKAGTQKTSAVAVIDVSEDASSEGGKALRLQRDDGVTDNISARQWLGSLPADYYTLSFAHQGPGAGDVYLERLDGAGGQHLAMRYGGEENWTTHIAGPESLEAGLYQVVITVDQLLGSPSAPRYFDAVHVARAGDGLIKDRDGMLSAYISEGMYNQSRAYGTQEIVHLNGNTESCAWEEVGCQQYTSADGGTVVNGIVNDAADSCPQECVGFSRYKQMPLYWDDEGVRTDGNQDFISDTAQQCLGGASAVGCEEYTNLEASGGERLEYFTYPRQCHPREVDAGACQLYYTFRGDANQGFVIQIDQLVARDAGTPSAPCTNYNAITHTCEDTPVNEGAIAQDVQNIVTGIAGSEEALEQDRGNVEVCIDDNDPDCQIYYDEQGNELGRYKVSATIPCIAPNTGASQADQCVSYRKTVDIHACTTYAANPNDAVAAAACACPDGHWDDVNNECLFDTYGRESRACGAVDNGCREYKGSTGNVFEIVSDATFEIDQTCTLESACGAGEGATCACEVDGANVCSVLDGETSCRYLNADGFRGGYVSNTAQVIGQHSYAAQPADFQGITRSLVAKGLGFVVEQGSTYELRFNATGTASMPDGTTISAAIVEDGDLATGTNVVNFGTGGSVQTATLGGLITNPFGNSGTIQANDAEEQIASGQQLVDDGNARIAQAEIAIVVANEQLVDGNALVTNAQLFLDAANAFATDAQSYSNGGSLVITEERTTDLGEALQGYAGVLTATANNLLTLINAGDWGDQASLSGSVDAFADDAGAYLVNPTLTAAQSLATDGTNLLSHVTNPDVVGLVVIADGRIDSGQALAATGETLRSGLAAGTYNGTAFRAAVNNLIAQVQLFVDNNPCPGSQFVCTDYVVSSNGIVTPEGTALTDSANALGNTASQLLGDLADVPAGYADAFIAALTASANDFNADAATFSQGPSEDAASALQADATILQAQLDGIPSAVQAAIDPLFADADMMIDAGVTLRNRAVSFTNTVNGFLRQVNDYISSGAPALVAVGEFPTDLGQSLIDNSALIAGSQLTGLLSSGAYGDHMNDLSTLQTYANNASALVTKPSIAAANPVTVIDDVRGILSSLVDQGNVIIVAGNAAANQANIDFAAGNALVNNGQSLIVAGNDALGNALVTLGDQGRVGVSGLAYQWRPYRFSTVYIDFTPTYDTTLVIYASDNGATSGSFLIDDVEIRRVTDDTQYVIKDSWNTPDSCNTASPQSTCTLEGICADGGCACGDDAANGNAVADDDALCFVEVGYHSCNYTQGGFAGSPGYALGCEAFTNKDGEQKNLKSFSGLCTGGAIGCSAVIDTQNTASVYTTPATVQYPFAIPQDYIKPVIVDDANFCSSTENGCRAFGLPTTINPENPVVESWETKYFRDLPDNYYGNDGILCQKAQEGCVTLQSNGSDVQVKDPTLAYCDYDTDAEDWVLHDTLGQPCRRPSELATALMTGVVRGELTGPAGIDHVPQQVESSGTQLVVDEAPIFAQSFLDSNVLINVSSQLGTGDVYTGVLGAAALNDVLYIAGFKQEQNSSAEFGFYAFDANTGKRIERDPFVLQMRALGIDPSKVSALFTDSGLFGSGQRLFMVFYRADVDRYYLASYDPLTRDVALIGADGASTTSLQEFFDASDLKDSDGNSFTFPSGVDILGVDYRENSVVFILGIRDQEGGYSAYRFLFIGSDKVVEFFDYPASQVLVGVVPSATFSYNGVSYLFLTSPTARLSGYVAKNIYSQTANFDFLNDFGLQDLPQSCLESEVSCAVFKEATHRTLQCDLGVDCAPGAPGYVNGTCTCSITNEIGTLATSCLVADGSSSCEVVTTGVGNEEFAYLTDTLDNATCSNDVDVAAGCLAFDNVSPRQGQGATQLATNDLGLSRQLTSVPGLSLPNSSCNPRSCYDSFFHEFERGGAIGLFVGGAGCSEERPPCNTSDVFKVDKDRVCSAALTCTSSSFQNDPTNQELATCTAYEVEKINSSVEGAISFSDALKFGASPSEIGTGLLDADSYALRENGFTGGELGYAIPNSVSVASMTQLNYDITPSDDTAVSIDLLLTGYSPIQERDENAAATLCDRVITPIGQKCTVQQGVDSEGNTFYQAYFYQGKTCRLYPEDNAPFSEYNTNIENRCADGEDCDCNYKRVDYGGLLTQYIGADTEPKSGYKQESRDTFTSCDNATDLGCQVITDIQAFQGLQGYCLEWDTTKTAGGVNKDGVPDAVCGLWYPVKFLNGDKNLVANALEATWQPQVKDIFICAESMLQEWRWKMYGFARGDEGSSNYLQANQWLKEGPMDNKRYVEGLSTSADAVMCCEKTETIKYKPNQNTPSKESAECVAEPYSYTGDLQNEDLNNFGFGWFLYSGAVANIDRLTYTSGHFAETVKFSRNDDAFGQSRLVRSVCKTVVKVREGGYDRAFANRLQEGSFNLIGSEICELGYTCADDAGCACKKVGWGDSGCIVPKDKDSCAFSTAESIFGTENTSRYGGAAGLPYGMASSDMSLNNLVCAESVPSGLQDKAGVVSNILNPEIPYTEGVCGLYTAGWEGTNLPLAPAYANSSAYAASSKFDVFGAQKPCTPESPCANSNIEFECRVPRSLAFGKFQATLNQKQKDLNALAQAYYPPGYNDLGFGAFLANRGESQYSYFFDPAPWYENNERWWQGILGDDAVSDYENCVNTLASELLSLTYDPSNANDTLFSPEQLRHQFAENLPRCGWGVASDVINAVGEDYIPVSVAEAMGFASSAEALSAFGFTVPNDFTSIDTFNEPHINAPKASVAGSVNTDAKAALQNNLDRIGSLFGRIYRIYQLPEDSTIGNNWAPRRYTQIYPHYGYETEDEFARSNFDKYPIDYEDVYPLEYPDLPAGAHDPKTYADAAELLKTVRPQWTASIWMWESVGDFGPRLIREKNTTLHPTAKVDAQTGKTKIDQPDASKYFIFRPSIEDEGRCPIIEDMEGRGNPSVIIRDGEKQKPQHILTPIFPTAGRADADVAYYAKYCDNEDFVYRPGSVWSDDVTPEEKIKAGSGSPLDVNYSIPYFTITTTNNDSGQDTDLSAVRNDPVRNVSYNASVGSAFAIQFFAYDETGNQLPIRKVFVNWGDDNDSVEYNTWQSLKNRKPSCSGLGWGNTTASCDTTPWQFQHTYGGVGDFMIVVVVEDNWGWKTAAARLVHIK